MIVLEQKISALDLTGTEIEESGETESGTLHTATAPKKKSKSKKKKLTHHQTEPPTIPIALLFPNGIFPPGEEQELKYDNLWRVTNEEKRHLERLEFDNLNEARKAAEVHRQVRKYAQKTIKPGMTMIEVAEIVENGTRALIQENGLEAGIGFPTGARRSDHRGITKSCRSSLHTKP